MDEQQEILKTLERCIKYDLLSKDAVIKINQIMIEDLEEDMPEEEISQGYERDIDPECSGGACPVR